MKKFFTVFALVLSAGALTALSPAQAYSRTRTRRVTIRHGCRFSGHDARPRTIYAFGSTAEAKAVVDRILGVVGVRRKFEVEAADVDNAEAGIDGYGNRYIWYNQEFMDRITRASQTDWARIAIMAHEIAHHLFDHDFKQTQNQHEKELDADSFSGHVLRYMNASLPQTQAAVNAYADEAGTETHPPKSSRLAAIRYGWGAADEIIKGWATQAGGQRSPRPDAPPAQLPAPRPTPRAVPQPAPQTYRLTADNTSRFLGQGWWDWTVYVNAPEEVLSHVSCVEYTLHPTFSPSVIRVCERGTGPAFGLRRKGWGTFGLGVRVFTRDGREYRLSHDLKLR